MLAVLRQRDFSLLWFGGVLSVIGDYFLFIALPFFVYERTGSVLATGAMFAAETLPRLLFGSVAGVFVDRWDRKRTMVFADLSRAMVLLPLLVVAAGGPFGLVLLDVGTYLVSALLISRIGAPTAAPDDEPDVTPEVAVSAWASALKEWL